METQSMLSIFLCSRRDERFASGSRAVPAIRANAFIKSLTILRLNFVQWVECKHRFSLAVWNAGSPYSLLGINQFFSGERKKGEGTILNQEQWVSSPSECVNHNASLNSQRCCFYFRFNHAGSICLCPHFSLTHFTVMKGVSHTTCYLCMSWRTCTSQQQCCPPSCSHVLAYQPSYHLVLEKAGEQQRKMPLMG